MTYQTQLSCYMLPKQNIILYSFRDVKAIEMKYWCMLLLFISHFWCHANVANDANYLHKLTNLIYWKLKRIKYSSSVNTISFRNYFNT